MKYKDNHIQDDLGKTNPDQNSPSILTATPQAQKFLKLISEKNDGAYIRIGLKRKGCAALSYRMSCITDPCPSDMPVNISADLKIYIQSNALMFIIGLTMDYVEEGLRSGFVFYNPKEKGRCGCGSSFYV
ncbi:HesB/IscA family protein [Holospora curviuscula]|uniref:Iron-binding protein IscA n=1 Tax=Holospora curviuscula TaxID=1082868 RepID=A0A2S5R921_9PROT|nr:iron-sulfur cluster assembly accessory protein [Holospora curviuscula]PPE03625.1 Iron-binding protein IscA [Holospora curviuscula]